MADTTEYKIEGHQNLRKKNGAVINDDYDEWLKAKNRIKNAGRIDDIQNNLNNLKKQISDLDKKLDSILGLLKK